MFRRKEKENRGGSNVAELGPAVQAPSIGAPEVNDMGPPVAGIGDPNKESGVKSKLSTHRRRFKENLGQKFGKEAEEDAEFEMRYNKVMDIMKKALVIRDCMKTQMELSRKLCGSCADLGNACQDADVRDVQFNNCQFQLDESIRKNLDDNVANALESLEKKCRPFQELAKRCKVRSNLKLDYDHYVRKVKDLKENPKSDVSKLSGNEAKLEAAKQKVADATASLYRAFNYYDAIGGRLVTPEIEMFKAAQRSFFSTALEATSQLEIRDPVQVAEEIEAIGREGALNLLITTTSSSLTLPHPSHSPSSLTLPHPSHSPSSLTLPLIPSQAWVLGRNQASKGHARLTATSSSSSSSSSSTYIGGSGSWWDQGSSPGATQQPSAPQPAAMPTFGGGGMMGTPAAMPPPLCRNHQFAKALYNYTAQDTSEISLTAGETIVLMEKHESGWWTGEKNGAKGLFPSNYVELQ
ncbi:unnamed protein product [Chrysoparadoxa australica]